MTLLQGKHLQTIQGRTDIDPYCSAKEWYTQEAGTYSF